MVLLKNQACSLSTGLILNIPSPKHRVTLSQYHSHLARTTSLYLRLIFLYIN